jgi:hypothetical protein
LKKSWLSRFIDERAETVDVKEAIHFEPEGKLSRGIVEYRWGESAIKIVTMGRADSADAFVWEKYLVQRPFLYGVGKRGETLESTVEHLPWFYWEAASARFEGVAPFVKATPDSAMLVKGSPVAISRPSVIARSADVSKL